MELIQAIPCSRQNAKILWVDDTEVVGDGIAQLRPVFGDFFAQEFERGVGEFAIGGIGLVVRGMLVHHAPQPLDRVQMAQEAETKCSMTRRPDCASESCTSLA